ncbi:translocation/assembly module TamB domain-containing protein [Roseovarius sp. EL26]|uniref:translocation/assembly module TamB domain-containing protein n=1 Tax=Roseovarius sp. EL26 TaxID=2126672 RepID=UPI000EA27D40|nr:translocation/assembly module TamB domain-containing protein [Roseovarius sp. EL26]
MRKFVFISLFVAFTAPVFAQEEEASDDSSFLEGLIESSLSGASRDVVIKGFQGALSSNATLDEMTISDADGVWLTLRDASLVWTRSALLRGRLKVDELTASELIITRLPDSSEAPSTEDTVAQPFALPELPVSVNVGNINISQVKLDESILGEEVDLTVLGNLILEGGNGSALLDISRQPKNRGHLRLDSSYSNESRELKINLDLEEDAEGIGSKLLKVPGEPPLSLKVIADAPLSDFSADIVMATEGETRLAGVVTLKEEGQDPSERITHFSANMGGDMRALFTPDLQPFFGEKTLFSLQGTTTADGATDLERFFLSSAALQLDGAVDLGPGGWPRKFNVVGKLGGTGKTRLPTTGPATYIDTANITASYDVQAGEAWEMQLALSDFSRDDGISLAQTTVTANGTFGRLKPRKLAGDITLSIDGIAHENPDLARALDTALTGKTSVVWQKNTGINLRGLEFQTGDLKLLANGGLGGLSKGLPFRGRAYLSAGDLSRLSGLAQRDLGGAVQLALRGEAELIGDFFDADLSIRSTDLKIGETRLDPLLAGGAKLEVSARRDTTGTTLDSLTINSPEVDAQIQAHLNPDKGDLTLAAKLQELALVEPTLSGPATVDTAISWASGQDLTIDKLIATAMKAELSVSGAVNPEDKSLPFNGDIDFRAADLSAFAGIAQMPLSGVVDLQFTGAAQAGDDFINAPFAAELYLTSSDIEIGEERIDALMSGNTRLVAKAAQDEKGLRLDAFNIINDALTATAAGQLIKGEDGTFMLRAEIDDASAIDPRLNGSALLDTNLDWAGDTETMTLKHLSAAVFGADLSASGMVQPYDDTLPFDGTLTLKVPDLSEFAPLINMPLSGSIDLNSKGNGKFKGREFDVETNLQGNGLRTGNADLDALLGSKVVLELSAALQNKELDLRKLILSAAEVTADIKGSGPGSPISFDARLANLGRFAPGFDGALSANGQATLNDSSGENITLKMNAVGPGRATANISGDVIEYGKNVALAVSGVLPLGLINGFIKPTAIDGNARYDLQINGKPSLSAITGTVDIGPARVTDPSVNLALENIQGSANLSSGQANMNLTGQSALGGTIQASGPITLNPPLPADLAIKLNTFTIRDPELYQTSVNGDIKITGPLLAGALISGRIDLGKTEIRLSPSVGTGIKDLPGLRHVNEPASVRASRERAGLIKKEKSKPVIFPLDLAINAPNQIFVRGLGLDAELGGELQVRGTTKEVSPSGFFELIRGRIDIIGQRIELAEGLVDLRGSLIPYIRFVGETDTDEITAQVIVEGAADEPEITFSSSPDLPDEEIVAHLLFGRGLDSISPIQAAQLAAAVASLSNGGGGLDGGLRSRLGLSNLDIGSTEDGGTEVSAGTYLTDSIYSEITADSEGNEKINLNLDLTPSFTVKGSTSTDGNSGLGVFFERDY